MPLMSTDTPSADISILEGNPKSSSSSHDIHRQENAIQISNDNIDLFRVSFCVW